MEVLEGGHWNLQPIASRSGAQVTTWGGKGEVGEGKSLVGLSPLSVGSDATPGRQCQD